MSVTRSFSATKYAPDHFQPDEHSDPHAQRKMRGLLEQIDYTAFASNKAVIAQTVGDVDAGRMQRLAVAAAAARARWVAEALAIADSGPGAAAAQVAKLAEMRTAFLELSEAYEGLRRMVERGYVNYRPAPTAP
jgi:hypothetical protein